MSGGSNKITVREGSNYSFGQRGHKIITSSANGTAPANTYYIALQADSDVQYSATSLVTGSDDLGDANRPAESMRYGQYDTVTITGSGKIIGYLGVLED